MILKGETFPYDVLVSLGTTGKQIIKFAGRKLEQPFTKEEAEKVSTLGEDYRAEGYTLRLQNRAILLWTASFPRTPAEFGYLAHEIFHVADLMLRRAGLTLSDDSDEVWAYQVDWLTKKIYDSFHLVNNAKKARKK